MTTSELTSGPRRLDRVATEVVEESDLDFSGQAALEDRLRQETATLDGSGAWLIAWLDHAVLVGRVTVDQIITRRPVDLRYLQELRLFGQHGEWRLWRTVHGFGSRRRLDGQGETTDILDDDQSLWGTHVDLPAGGWTRLTESRGIVIELPVRLAEADLPLRLRVRHYLAADLDGVAGVADSRLVAIGNQRGEALVDQEGTHA